MPIGQEGASAQGFTRTPEAVKLTRWKKTVRSGMTQMKTQVRTPGGTVRTPLLAPIDRLSETLFGLFMTLTFTGSMSVAIGQGGTVQSILIAALGCNIAWGIVDGTMYLLRTATERKRTIGILAEIKSAPEADLPDIVRDLVADTSSRPLTNDDALMIANWVRRSDADSPTRPIRSTDLRAALAVFVTVVLATFPPVLPFIFLTDVFAAMRWSNGIAVAMLCVIGWQFDYYIGHGSRLMRVVVPLIGTVLVAVTIALGG
jgi:hypothetical protein